MKCEYCGAKMLLDGDNVYIGEGGVYVVERYLSCDCGASAYQELVNGKTEILDFYPPELSDN